MAIPVQNIYYLLCYAWGYYKPGSLADVESLDTSEQVDLFAKILVDGTNRLLRRGMDRSYQEFEREIAGVRGQIDFDGSLRKLLFQQGKTQCRVDELTHDVLHNQLLKATLRRLARVERLDRKLRRQLETAVRRLDTVSDLPRLEPVLFRRVRLHRNNQNYRLLLSVCELIVRSLLINEQTGEARIRDVLRDEVTMSGLFESFVRNFYQEELAGFHSGRVGLDWGATAADESQVKYLPTMKTDIVLTSRERVIIIDTKYYKDTLQGKSGSSVHSGNLYQLYAYLRAYERAYGRRRPIEGMLLYPVVQQELRLDYEIDGFRVQVCTVDLARQWREIREELLAIVEPAGQVAGQADSAGRGLVQA